MRTVRLPTVFCFIPGPMSEVGRLGVGVSTMYLWREGEYPPLEVPCMMGWVPTPLEILIGLGTRDTLHHPGKDLVPEIPSITLERTWYQRYPTTTLERTWYQRYPPSPWKGLGTRDTQPPRVDRMTDRRPWKHYLPPALLADGKIYNFILVLVWNFQSSQSQICGKEVCWQSLKDWCFLRFTLTH